MTLELMGYRRHDQTPSILDNKPPSPTEQHLLDLSKTLIELLNWRRYEHPFLEQHIRHNVFTELQGKRTIGLRSFLQNYQNDASGSPSFRVDVGINATAMVDENAGSGTVILSQHLLGLGGERGGLEKAATILFSWQKAKGRWRCSNATMIYGTPEFLV